jgi:hypothetical protein
MKEEKALAEKAKRKSEEIRKLKQKAREVEEDEESDPDCWVQTFLAFKSFLLLDYYPAFRFLNSLTKIQLKRKKKWKGKTRRRRQLMRMMRTTICFLE